MPDIKNTLQRLGLSFTVSDIMIAKNRLTCAQDEVDAPDVSERNPDYDVIPIIRQGKIAAFYERDSKRSKAISLDDLLGGATAVIELVEVLKNRTFCFVFVRSEIGGTCTSPTSTTRSLN